MPLECQETWSLCKEYLLCESERALMKLLWELQKDSTLEKVWYCRVIYFTLLIMT